MQPVRSHDAEHAFEEAWKKDQVQALVELAHRAASRGLLDEVEACLARIYLIAPEAVEGLADELYALADCVRKHPSYRPRGA